jgi:outer membrane protein
MNKLLLFIAFASFTFIGSAQKKWSLEDCLAYAQQNNLQIKQASLNVESSKKNLFQSKLALFPNLNSSLSDANSYGRNIDPVTNEITVDRVKSNNFSVSSSVNLFNGFQNINTIRRNNYQYLASKYDAQRIANDISVNIVTAYLQLLYSKELVNVNQEKLSLSQIQLDRILSMVEVGQLPKGSLLETEAQYAQDELILVNSQNQYEIALLNIKQLLDLTSEDAFDVIDPKIDPDLLSNIPSAEEVYTQAVANLPDVKKANYDLKTAERSLAISQGFRSPRLTLSTSWGTAYSDARKLFDGIDSSGLPKYIEYPFEDQIEDNVNQVISLSLNIPIFNAWQVNNNVSQSKIRVKQSQYNLQQTKNALRKTIEQARADVDAGNKQYLASLKTVEALKESFRYSETKHSVQLINSYQFYDAKNKLFSAENSLLQAKYDYIFKLKMLDFYMGNKLTF